MWLLLALRLAKILAVAVLFSGTIGTLFVSEQRDKDRFALGLALPGWIFTWAFGFGLASATGTSLFSGWILWSIALSLFAIVLLLFVGSRRRGVVAAAVCLTPLAAALALMVFKLPV